MTYLDTEVSQHGGKPTELYRFVGTYANFYYTSGQKKVTYQAPDEDEEHDYLPIALRRSEINCGTQDDDGLELNIELAVTNEIVQVYAFQNSPPQLDLTLFRFHTLDSVVRYWTGPINDINVSDGVATIRSPSTLANALAMNIPSVFFQSPCNNVLGDARCKVDMDDWTEAATITAIDGRVLTVNSVGTLGGKLIGGEVLLVSGERRMIVAQNLLEIIVNFPFSQIEVADIVEIAAGCDLAYNGDCKTKFDNGRNFGGFPFIPSSNVFQDGIDPSIVPLPDNTCLPEPFAGPTTIFHYSQPDPCNPTYGATRQLYFPETQPNAPHGKVLSAFNGLPGNGTSYIFENDYTGTEHEDDPAYANCRGQLLVTFVMGNLDYLVTFHFSVNSGGWSLTNQYPAFFCGSVGKAHGIQRIEMCRSNPPEFPFCMLATIREDEVAGNVPYNLDFEF